MKSEREGLLEHLSVMAQDLSADSVSTLARYLAVLGSADDLRPSRGATVPIRVMLQRLKDLWVASPSVTGKAVAFALEAAQRTSDSVSKRETLELTWTGPKSYGMTVRRNDQALLEVIASAEKELLLVSYVVYNVPHVVRAISEASDRGVITRLVLEFHGPDELGQKLNPLTAFGTLPKDVRAYEWPFEQRSLFPDTKKKGYVHAKCAVADRHVAFISSANLTTYAMDANLELGVLVRGGSIPARITANFDDLIADGILLQRLP